MNERASDFITSTHPTKTSESSQKIVDFRKIVAGENSTIEENKAG